MGDYETELDFGEQVRQAVDEGVTRAVDRHYAPSTMEARFTTGARLALAFITYRTAARASSGGAKAWYWFGAGLNVVALLVSPALFKRVEAERVRRLELLEPQARMLLETGVSE